jgi:hypothetical protein
MALPVNIAETPSCQRSLGVEGRKGLLHRQLGGLAALVSPVPPLFGGGRTHCFQSQAISKTKLFDGSYLDPQWIVE